MTKMEQVAAMFGKKINERFIVDYHIEKIEVMFMIYGLVEFSNKGGSRLNNDLLVALLTGEVVIVDD